jgi:predicted aspartyl protease
VISRLAIALVLVAASALGHPLGFHNGRLFINAEVNGVPTEALLDSGAEATLIDERFADKANLPEGTAQKLRGSGGGTTTAHIIEGLTIKALGVELHPDAAVVTDLADLSTRLIKRPTAVVVGRELFDAARLRIDIGAGRIASVPKTAIPRGKRLALTAHAGIESIHVLADGRKAQAEFDLGNGSDVLISRAFANKLGLKVIGSRAGGGIGGAVQRDLVTIGSLDMAGARFRNVTAAIDDQSSADDLNVGTAVLKHFVITTDFAARSVWLAADRSVSRGYRNHADK